ncbi:hypothetical protein MPTK1_3g03760 [Marchantia polymorpha subsp. ruderalis]|nr:hypothetical protein MARPO_0022s0156 [Marchantia polymorpha]BBN04338.1 hypothetical protein Mp_3g03760 [Marchantia polymorpha subsp. ruderalis]|eukprot:PTQ44067.1 hypothetical protein MARPO_0022s0156 [Marchantia polymorpha]
MAERNSWNWNSSVEARKASDVFHGDTYDEMAGQGQQHQHQHQQQQQQQQQPSTGAYRTQPSRRVSLKGNAGLTSKILTLKERLANARMECLELRQEASDLQEYSTVKITRATRYLGVLSDKARKLDQVALDWEARVTPIRDERKKLLNELLNQRGNVQVHCRVRPQFEDEGPVITSYPSDSTIRLTPPATPGSTLPGKMEFEFDRVYGPHIGQVDIFEDVQPMIQSALDGFNVSIFAFGQSGTGKTYTLEGTSRDPGLFYRAVEELFQLSNVDASPASRTVFHVTMFELQDEQFKDLLQHSVDPSKAFQAEMGEVGRTLKLVGERIDSARDFSRVFNTGTRNRAVENFSFDQSTTSYLILTIHIHHTNILLREKYQSKISFVDMPASDQHLRVEASITVLGDVLAAITTKEDYVPYRNSLLTSVLADSLGGDNKTLVIVNVSPCSLDLAETLSSINFGTRARSKSAASSAQEDAQLELAEKQKEIAKLEQENQRLEKALKESDEQCATLLSALQKANSQEKSKEVDDGITRSSQAWELQQAKQAISEAVLTNKRLEEELAKRDELIERLHEENEKLFERLTKPMESARNAALAEQQQQQQQRIKDSEDSAHRSPGGHGSAMDREVSTPPRQDPSAGTMVTTPPSALLSVKSTPAGEYLSAALLDFNPDQYDSPAAIGDGANKLLMLVLAAVIKAGAAREHEMLAEIRDAVFTFIRRMESRAVMDTMLVSRVRILYIRSLCSRSSELQAIQLPPVEKFLERAGSGTPSRRSSSRESSPGRAPLLSPKLFHHSKSNVDDHLARFKVNLGQEKKSKISSFFGKLRGGDQQHAQQNLTGGKLRETSDDARYYAIGNKALAALFVHTPAGELQRQIRAWLSQNFDPLATPNGESVEAQLESLSTAIMDGWMSGLGVPQRPSTDALGQLLSDYTKLVYSSELQHLKDVAATLATEEAEEIAQVAQLRSGLESVEHKRRKVMQQMRSDVALLTKEEGGSPFRTPSSANEDARIASLISLEDILKQADDIIREARQKAGSSSLKKSLSGRMSTLSERMPTLLPIDYACAQRAIGEAQKAVESIQEVGNDHQHRSQSSMSESSDAPPTSGDLEDADGDVVQWSVLQFNNGSATPLVLKCGATPSLELVVKATARLQDKNGKEVVSVVPSPSALNGLSLDEIRQILSQVPEAFSNLALARSADGTRARYTRLYKTLAVRVPALRSSVNSLDSESAKELANLQSSSTKWQAQNHGRRKSDVDDFGGDEPH